MHHIASESERLLTELDFSRLNKLREGQTLPPELADALDTLDLVPPSSDDTRRRTDVGRIQPYPGSDRESIGRVHRRDKGNVDNGCWTESNQPAS